MRNYEEILKQTVEHIEWQLEELERERTLIQGKIEALETIKANIVGQVNNYEKTL
jgi:hypothetical protein